MAATLLNPEPMDFLITGKFGNGPKLGLCCRELGKLGVYDNFVFKIEDLHPNFFPKVRFEYPIISTFRL